MGRFCVNAQAFEAHPGNVALAQHNLAGLPGISLTFGAVFRSDCSVRRLLHSGPLASNTGAGNVMFGGKLFDSLAPAESNSPGDALETPAMSFDQILDAFDHVRLVKLDCEGSEYPILLDFIGSCAKLTVWSANTTSSRKQSALLTHARARRAP